MIDWYMLLLPLLLLPIAMLFVFLGCTLVDAPDRSLLTPPGALVRLELVFPVEGFEEAIVMFRWEMVGSGLMTSQRFPPGPISEPSPGRRRVEWFASVSAGEWLFVCLFSTVAGAAFDSSDWLRNACSLSLRETEDATVEFFLTQDEDNNPNLEVITCQSEGRRIYSR